MKPRKWEIWFVNMPFDEGIGSKPRPALVIDTQTNYVVVGKMTKHAPRPEYQYEYRLIDWRGAGLKFPTTLRLSKIAALQESDFIRKLGDIQPIDQMHVRELLKLILDDLP